MLQPIAVRRPPSAVARCAARFATVLAGLAALLPAAAYAGTSNSLMDLTHDGALLATANRDNATVSIVETATGEVLREVPVGRHPEGVSFVGDTTRLVVTVYDEDVVVVLEAGTGEELARIPVFDEPYGVVVDPEGRRAYVTEDYPGLVAEIDLETMQLVREIPAGSFLRGIAISPDGGRLYVTEYYTAGVHALDLASGEVVESWPGGRTTNLARQIALHPNRPKAYVPHIRSVVTNAHGTGAIFPYIASLDTDSPAADLSSSPPFQGGAGGGNGNAETPGRGDATADAATSAAGQAGSTARTPRRRRSIAMDSINGIYVTANPWECAVSPDGNRLYVVFSGTNDMNVCEIADDGVTELRPGPRIVRLGNNPRAVRVSPDGGTFYVYNTLDFQVVAYDAETLRPLRTIQVCENPLGDEILRGKILFYRADEPMSARRWVSCSSCHIDGQADGRTWHQPEGLRQTTSLFGMAYTHPIHWSADRDEAQDFEITIRSLLMQGRGLIDGEVHDALAEPNAGLSADLDALAAYCNSLEFTLSPHARDGLSEAAQRGREIFFRADVGCAQCHSGPFYTDSGLLRSPPSEGGAGGGDDDAETRGRGDAERGGRGDAENGAGDAPAADLPTFHTTTNSAGFILHDVGTGDDDPTELMGPAYDTPTLLGIYRTAPYLHDGRAATLEEVLTTHNPDDRHGRTSHLSADEIADLVEFLRALPYEDPVAAAEAAGLEPESE